MTERYGYLIVFADKPAIMSTQYWDRENLARLIGQEIAKEYPDGKLVISVTYSMPQNMRHRRACNSISVCSTHRHFPEPKQEDTIGILDMGGPA